MDFKFCVVKSFNADFDHRLWSMNFINYDELSPIKIIHDQSMIINDDQSISITISYSQPRQIMCAHDLHVQSNYNQSKINQYRP